ncbi:hypothetical protein JCM24511_09020 [Saitozyma sp. JCM 24511]|nr:hypothetical protein JCM24511_09020 [Saitozyma sp. JCM 24511]
MAIEIPETAVVPDDVAPLTAKQKVLVHATEPILRQHGVAITTRMYQTMLVAHPELKNIFSMSGQASGEQQKALAGSLVAYAAHIEDLAPLVGVVQRIAAKHAALGVKPQHYPIVGEHLIGAIVHVLGEAFTPELQDAWYHAYWNLARLFIELESEIRAAAPWPDFTTFRIANKVEESPSITSFYLQPTDKALLPLRPYLPGQYLTVRVWVEALQHFQCRHYTLSDAPDPAHYRITVKREDGDANGDGDASPDTPSSSPGMVSNTLHSLPVAADIQASFPAGTFIIPDPLPGHVIFLSAGVGITPNLAMLNSLVDLDLDSPKAPKITWIQGARNRVEHVFARHVREIGQKCGEKFHEVVFYSQPGPSAGMGVMGGKHRSGRVDLKALDRETLALHDPEALYYICGPPGFMSAMVQSLVELGVANGNIRFEAFAPGEIEMA